MKAENRPVRAYADADSIIIPAASMLIAIISNLVGASLAKQLFPLFGPAGAAALRMAFAGVMLALWFRPWRARFKRRNLAPICIYGLAIAGMNTLFYMAMSRIPLGIAVAIEFMGPLTVAVAASRRPIDFLWAALAATGLLLLTPIAAQGEPLDPLGIICGLGSAIFWGTYIVAGKWASRDHEAGTAASMGMIVATMLIMPIGIATVHAALFQPLVLGVALTVALLSGAIPFALEMFALRRIPAGTFGVLLSAEPAVAALAGFIFLHEVLTLNQCLAILAIVAASAGAMTTASSRVPKVTDVP